MERMLKQILKGLVLLAIGFAIIAPPLFAVVLRLCILIIGCYFIAMGLRTIFSARRNL